MGISCCPNREFISISDLDRGELFTTVELQTGDRLEIFCKYANLSAFKKLKEIAPSIAKDQYLFHEKEIVKMLEFLSKEQEVELNTLIVFKIYMSGTKEVDPHSKSNLNEVSSLDFNFNAECNRNGDEIKEIMKYKYNWRKKDLFATGEALQQVSFFNYKTTILDECVGMS